MNEFTSAKPRYYIEKLQKKILNNCYYRWRTTIQITLEDTEEERMPRMLITLLLAAAAQASAHEVPQTKGTLDAATRHALVKELAQAVEDNYVFPDVAKKVAASLRQKDAKNAYASANTVTSLADMLTADLRSSGKDLHFSVRFDPAFKAAPENAVPSAEELIQQREETERLAGGIFRVERLPGNVGYLDVRGFETAAFSAPAIGAAMTLLKNTEAIILDLRKNGGGDSETVAYLLSHFFAEGDRRHLNDLVYRKDQRKEQSWTSTAVSVHYTRPVYVLTSKWTFSAAEECAYDFQTQKRATLVGEATGGAANPGGSFPLGGGLVAFISTGQAVNPITHTNWEGSGVKPDVATPADLALDVANARVLRDIVIPKIGDDKARAQLIAEAERLEKAAAK
ncbi:S41 family peptidase [Massilia sp. erpn]|uniref:S41 family peptidase n=1 Tax=Massilia sp. erpn TaxID=2738142 RepID=UPI002104F2BE|nr:S41 family peptidase [Massilia sp. erpn]UTY57792.1 S41 family peptidase [Massilia sp. erpn]